MDESTYRALPHMNASTLVHSLRSMKRMRRMMTEPQSRIVTPDMEFGTAVHMAILEPAQFNAEYVVMPDFHRDGANVTQGGKSTNSKATSYYKQSVEQFERENQGRKILSRYDMDRIMQCVKAVSDKGLDHLIHSCSKEVVLLGQIDGVECKGKLDLLKPGYLADLKTTNDCELRAFGRTFSKLAYGFRMAFYRELANQNGYQIERVQMIAVETSGDYDCVVYDVPDIALDIQFRRIREQLQRYKECMASGVWPGVDGGSETLMVHLPPWEMEPDELMDWGTESDSETPEVIF
jgi:hypothetical protein